jgi:hypothetical protein
VNTPNFRPRSATELVDATVRLYRGNFAAFLTLSAALYVPLQVIAWILPATFSTGIASLVTLPLTLAWGAAWYTIIIAFVGELYTTGTADIASAIKRGLVRMTPALGASALCLLGVFLGFIALIIPGFILLLMWFAIPATVLFEDLDPIAALQRSAALSRNVKGHIATCFFILGLLTGAIGLLAALIGGGLALLLNVGSTENKLELVQVISTLCNIFLGALTPIMATLLYFDARIRNEGYDIELMARRVGGTAAPVSA